MLTRLRRIEGSACVLLLIVLLVSAACHRAPSASSTNATQQSAPQYERIISLSPSTTEVLYGLGLFPRVIAVSDYDEFPPEVKRLPHIGGWSNTNLEQVASLRPDLVVMADAQAPFVKDKLDALGLKTLAVPSRSVEDALTSIAQLGSATGHEREAQQLINETRAKLEDVRARTRELPRLRVLCIVDRVPGTLRGLYAATAESFIGQLIETAGGTSIAPAAPSGFGQISKEAVVTLDPEVIIDLEQNTTDTNNRLAEDTQAVWRELSQVKAVRDGRVYAVRDTSVLHPSQFVGDAAQKFAALLHPEVFKQGDK
ncbi:MAG: ABC transporter substrate-binding protein [Pyrinomonadaceae bacterium]